MTKARIKKLLSESRSIAAAAAELQREAVRLSAEALRLETFAYDEQRLAGLPRALDELRQALDHGEDQARATQRIANHYELPLKLLAGKFDTWRKTSYAAFKWRRDREIFRLARAGLSNAEIASRVGLVAKSVSRIIRQKIAAGALRAGLSRGTIADLANNFSQEPHPENGAIFAISAPAQQSFALQSSYTHKTGSSGITLPLGRTPPFLPCSKSHQTGENDHA